MSCKEKEMGFNRDLLTPAKIAEFPLLDGCDVDLLYQKAIVMQRQVTFELMYAHSSDKYVFYVNKFLTLFVLLVCFTMCMKSFDYGASKFSTKN